MGFPENKSRVEEVIKRSWDLSSREIYHLRVAPDSPCQPPSHSTDLRPHPASPSRGNRQHLGDHLLRLAFRGKEKPQTAALQALLPNSSLDWGSW